MSLSDHDVLVKAIVAVLSAHGFEVQYVIKGVKTERIRVQGDSGLNYYPDVMAKKGFTTLVGDVRTRGQRGTQDKVDRGAIQFMQAELDDWIACLNRPHGMIVTPHGANDEATRLAAHFGIYIVTLPMDVARVIAGFDVVSQKEKIVDVARKSNVVF